ncbi:hypothetical protein GIB67_028974, partial [Kingdonia uniflora]
AIQRNSPTVIATANVADIPPKLVNPDAVELVLEVRRQYSSKLNQFEERAKKLRENLAVEEYRGQELGQQNNVERWKMSKRLTEEAMKYFDECVSKSTFDSSDFSSTEDTPSNLGAFDSLVADDRAFPSASSSASTHYVASRNHDKNKATFDCLHKTYGFLTPNFWRETRFNKSPFQEWIDILKTPTKITLVIEPVKK